MKEGEQTYLRSKAEADSGLGVQEPSQGWLGVLQHAFGSAIQVGRQ